MKQLPTFSIKYCSYKKSAKFSFHRTAIKKDFGQFIKKTLVNYCPQVAPCDDSSSKIDD